jgi:twinkle protein
MAHNMTQHKLPCFAILLEETNKKTVRNICGKIDNLMYNTPDVYNKNIDRFYETARQLENQLYVWNSAGNTSLRFDIKEILSAIRYNHLEYGCMMFYLDNMTKLVDGLTTSAANEYINKYSSELANLASELDINVCLFSHLNTPQSGPDHEHGGQVFLSQLTGSKGIMRSFATALGFERNQYATNGKDQNSLIRVLKNREHGDKIAVKTQYSKVTGRLLEYNWEGDSLTV